MTTTSFPVAARQAADLTPDPLPCARPSLRGGYAVVPERPEHWPRVEELLDRAFGIDRRVKISYRYRSGVPPLAELSLAAVQPSEEGASRLVGTIRFWPVRLGEAAALLLGPLACEPGLRGAGIGRALVHAGLAKAMAQPVPLVFLVGDHAYYRQFGFATAPSAIVMPGEDPARLQWLGLHGAALPRQGGILRPAERLPERTRAFAPSPSSTTAVMAPPGPSWPSAEERGAALAARA